MPKIESPRLATVEEFTHAIIGIARTVTIHDAEGWTSFDLISQMIAARDAAIRAERDELLQTLKDKIEQAVEEVRAIETYDAHCTLDEALAALREAGAM